MTKAHTKRSIAHELGHALMGHLYDTRMVVITFTLDPNNEPMCEADIHHDLNISKPLHLYNNSYTLYLGGILGELIYCTNFKPWGCIEDITSYISSFDIENLKLTSKLYDEVYHWFFFDENGFNNVVCLPIHERADYSLTSFKLQESMPELFQMYTQVKFTISTDGFIKLVNKLYKNNDMKISELKLELERLIL